MVKYAGMSELIKAPPHILLEGLRQINREKDIRKYRRELALQLLRVYEETGIFDLQLVEQVFRLPLGFNKYLYPISMRQLHASEYKAITPHDLYAEREYGLMIAISPNKRAFESMVLTPLNRDYASNFELLGQAGIIVNSAAPSLDQAVFF